MATTKIAIEAIHRNTSETMLGRKQGESLVYRKQSVAKAIMGNVAAWAIPPSLTINCGSRCKIYKTSAVTGKSTQNSFSNLDLSSWVGVAMAPTIDMKSTTILLLAAQER